MDPETMAMLNYYLAMQTDMDPYMSSMLGGLISPNVDKRGNLDQFGVDLEKTNLNQYQDIAGTFGNPMNSLLAGVGSFGPTPTGGGVVGGGGLNPITTESILETPIMNRLNYTAGMQGLEGLVAQKLLAGQSPSLILADLKAKIEGDDPSIDETTRALFANSLPQKDVIGPGGAPTGETTVDWNAARSELTKQAQDFAGEAGMLSGPNIGQNAYGQYVQYSEQPSEMMQYLQKLGLPDPRAQYGIDFSIQSDPQLASLYSDIGAKGQAFDQAKSAYEKYLKDKPIAQEMGRQAQAMEDKRKAAYAQQMGNYARDMAEWAKTQPLPTTPQRVTPEPGAPGWMKAIGGGISDLASGTGDYLGEQLGRIAGRPIAPRGAQLQPSNLPMAGDQLPKPTLPTLGGPSLIEQMYSKMNTPDRTYALAGQMNKAAQAQGSDILAMVRAIAPGYRAAQSGRSPFKDAIMQRLQPILAAGGARR